MVTRRRPRPLALPQAQWASCGITMGVTPDGQPVPTHPRGDQHAADIIAGRYPLAQAERDHRAARATLVAMRVGRAVLAELLHRLDGRPWAPTRTRR